MFKTCGEGGVLCIMEGWITVMAYAVVVAGVFKETVVCDGSNVMLRQRKRECQSVILSPLETATLA